MSRLVLICVSVSQTQTCVPIPPSLDQIVANSEIGLNLNTSEVFIVSLPEKLEQTISAVANYASSNTTVVIGLGSSEYVQTEELAINTDFVLVADNNLTLQNGNFDFRRARERRLQTTVVDSVIIAGEGIRHYTVGAIRFVTNGIVLQGNPLGMCSGGVVLQGTQANVLNTTFRGCRWNGDGGGLALTSAARCTIGRLVCASGCKAQAN